MYIRVAIFSCLLLACGRIPRSEIQSTRICAPARGAYTLGFHRTSGNCSGDFIVEVLISQPSSIVPPGCTFIEDSESTDGCHMSSDKTCRYEEVDTRFVTSIEWDDEGQNGVGRLEATKTTSMGALMCRGAYDLTYVKISR